MEHELYIIQASKCNNSTAYNATMLDAAALNPHHPRKTKLHEYIDIKVRHHENAIKSLFYLFALVSFAKPGVTKRI